jgi:hypothetical protein
MIYDVLNKDSGETRQAMADDPMTALLSILDIVAPCGSWEIDPAPDGLFFVRFGSGFIEYYEVTPIGPHAAFIAAIDFDPDCDLPF